MQHCTAVCGNGMPCKNTAHYQVGGKLLCGVHSRNKDRKEVPKQKVDKVEIWAEHELTLQPCDEPCIKLFRMAMMKAVPLTPGFRNVFPNNKHQNRRDGFGCSSLSPMKLGPVVHGQPGLPNALNIEVFHQSNKKYKCETMDEFRKTRLTWYTNPPEKIRHKFTGKDKPEYFVWLDKNGKEHHLNHVESRQFYCTFYERLASQTDDYKKLAQMILNGYNLCLCGYDAHELGNIEEDYLDTTKPFGHERVLYCMLIGEYPWRKHKTFDF